MEFKVNKNALKEIEELAKQKTAEIAEEIIKESGIGDKGAIKSTDNGAKIEIEDQETIKRELGGQKRRPEAMIRRAIGRISRGGRKGEKAGEARGRNEQKNGQSASSSKRAGA